MVTAVIAVLVVAAVLVYKFGFRGDNTPSSSEPTGSSEAGDSSSSSSAPTGSASTGAGDYKLTINGSQETPKGNPNITCSLSPLYSNQNGVPSGTGLYDIHFGRNGDASFYNTTPLQVAQISLGDGKGNSYLLSPSQVRQHHGGGNVQITKDGNTFKMVGDIAPYTDAHGKTLEDATPVPFEFDVTCPEITTHG
ncbi:lipoprotein LpqH [Mycobacterium colombiense]|uniref:lipoprotein LpqH n=1 Tax=Mycobacterium colombiense TaxID=339268 RepID=UPI001E582A0F|nr:lipoprotein LpqH [Mycobacterium colombiense]